MTLVCGIDVGTSAVRALACDLQGTVHAAAAAELQPVRSAGAAREQDAEDWWRGVCAVLRQVTAQVGAEAITTVAVDATSGTIVPVDRGLQPLGPGLMYNDGRAVGYGEQVDRAAPEFVASHGYSFKDSFALPKLLWLRDRDPAFSRTWKILHQSDFVNARLLGEAPATDWSNALKSGCELVAAGQGGSGWPAWIGDRLHFPVDKLPAPVVAPGARIGQVCAAAAAATSLAMGTAVVAGASDGTAALLASGAGRPGDFNTTLGSTLVLKGITRAIVHDPDGVIYCHRHPGGYWLPGGAGNVGCAAVDRSFAPDPASRGAILRELDQSIDRFLPSPILAYPLGDLTEERFPFRRRGIADFVVGQPASRAEHYAAMLQGIAFVERWCYEKLAELGASAERIFSTGGGSRSAPWRQLRADVLGRPILLPSQTETAFGAAILAAAHLHRDALHPTGGLEAASAAMVRVQGHTEPGSRRFDEAYQAFRDECRQRWSVG